MTLAKPKVQANTRTFSGTARSPRVDRRQQFMVNPYETPKQVVAEGRRRISLRLTLLAVSMPALSIGLLILNIIAVHSVTLAVSSLILLGISIGWPIGYLFARLRGAVVCSGCGVLFVFAALYVLVEVFDLLG